MHMCSKCSRITALLFLTAGVLFLLADLGVWGFWGLNWWTVVLLVLGTVHFGSSSCKDCESMYTGKKK